MTAAIQDVPGLPPLCYQWLFDNSPQAQCVYDASSLRLLAANRAAASHFGYSVAELLLKTLPDLYHADEVKPLHQFLGQPLDAQQSLSLWHHRHSTGVCTAVETAIQAFEWDGVQAHLITPRPEVAPGVQLATSELADLVDGIPHAFFTLDHNGCFSYVNDYAVKMMRRPLRALLGRNVWEVFPEVKGTVFYTEYERVKAGGKPASFEAYHAPKDGWREVVVFPIVSGLAIHYRDVTEKHRHHAQLLEERDTLAAVVAASRDAIVTVDAGGLIVTANPSTERVFGHTAQSLIGHPVEVLMPLRYRGVHPQHHAEFVASDVQSRMMGLGSVKGLTADGKEVDLEGTMTRVTIGKKNKVLVNLRDVTARVRADAEVVRSRKQRSELTQRLMAQEKALVRSIAQSLHDQLGQTLAAIRMGHETMIAVQSGTASLELTQLLTQQSARIGQAVRQVRQVLSDLRPTLLEEQGLAAALDNKLRNRAQAFPEIDFSIDVALPVAAMRWPVDVEYVAFMVVRESVENSVRHSGSRSLHVCLGGNAQTLELDIMDEGIGMAVDTIPLSGHLGILGMRERAHAVGATLTMHANTPRGTRVHLHWQVAP